MSFSNLFGTWLPFIGWREWEEDVIKEVSEYVDINPSHRYSGFQVAWLGYTFGMGLRDLGPRESGLEA